MEQSVKDLRGEISIKDEDLKQHSEQLSDFSRSFSNLKISSNLNEDLDLHIDNIDSLPILIDQLDYFIDFIENRATTCKHALEIFETIGNEEKEKINQLFDKDSVCIKFFNKITNGKYADIIFDSANSQIYVKKSVGEDNSADKLSEGAYDQLYFAIRVDLAQRILGDESGFLIMDDIFLSYDTERLEEAFDILKKLADMGWQIIYFTAKDEVCNQFSRVTDNELIKLKPLM